MKTSSDVNSCSGVPLMSHDHATADGSRHESMFETEK